MQVRQLMVAAAAALALGSAHALPSLPTDLGTDPVGATVGGFAVFNGLSTEYTFSLLSGTGIVGELFGGGDITMTSIMLTGGASNISVFAPLPDSGMFSFGNLGAGDYTLTFTAASSSPFSFGGFTGSVTAVPEAETYALALAGLGVVGLVAARRKKVH
ncbi:FxDxF family PEP-CTERM protein [Aquabacterium sp. A3]|uniref:FxDxF family PEP-CTERM protein n=1 Tax=Aquabacterium sp. A3 TaxID=3132829 RepID=UPI00311A789D